MANCAYVIILQWLHSSEPLLSPLTRLLRALQRKRIQLKKHRGVIRQILQFGSWWLNELLSLHGVNRRKNGSGSDGLEKQINAGTVAGGGREAPG